MRTEGQYAHSKNKTIVALRLERDYEPDGWLGPLCLNDLYYDFSEPQKFEEQWSKLHAKLMELNTSGISVCVVTTLFLYLVLSAVIGKQVFLVEYYSRQVHGHVASATCGRLG